MTLEQRLTAEWSSILIQLRSLGYYGSLVRYCPYGFYDEQGHIHTFESITHEISSSPACPRIIESMRAYAALELCYRGKRLELEIAVVTDGAVAACARGEDTYDYTEDLSGLLDSFRRMTPLALVVKQDNEAGILVLALPGQTHLTTQQEKWWSYHKEITSYDIAMRKIAQEERAERCGEKYRD
jgi:hypothetical protein